MKYTLIIEPTNNCTAKCTTCITHKSKYKKGFMQENIFRKILKDSKEIEIEAIQLNGQGEGMLHDNWENLPKIVREYYPEKEIRLITNGSIYKKVPKEVNDFQVSFNAGTKEDYEKITSLSFYNTIFNILKWKKDGIMDAIGSIHIVVFKDNVHTVENFKKIFKGCKLELSYKYDNQCGKIEDKTLEHLKIKEKVTCTYLTHIIYVDWAGNVVMCPHDVEKTTIYGNVQTDALKNIIFSSKRLDIIKEHKNYRFNNLCKNCNFNLDIDGKDLFFTEDLRGEL